MAVKRISISQAVGLGDSLLTLPPLPIIARRDPTAADQAEIGTLWCNVVSSTVWCLASITAGASVWTTSAGSGVGIFTSVTVTPGDVDVTDGDVNVDLGDINVPVGDVNIGGDLTVNGTTTLNGDIDFTSAALIDLTSTLDAAPSILLHANGGTAESIELHSDQGTGNNSIFIHSDVGGVNIASARNGASAIVVEAQAGGLDILASAAAAGEDINIIATGSSINITATENAANSIVISSSVGGIDITAAGASAGEDIDITATGSSINIVASEAAINAVRINASGAAGGIDVDAGTGGITIDTTGAISIDSATASNMTVTGAGQDLTLSSVGGSVLVSSTEDAALAIRLYANGGTSETIQVHADQGTGVASVDLLSDVGGITLSAGLGTADAINIVASNAAGGIDIDAGSAGIAMDVASGSITMTAGTGGNGSITMTSTGTGDIVLDSDDTMLLDSDGILELNSSAGVISVGNDAVAQGINIGTGAAARPIVIGNTTAGTTVTINTPTNVGLTLPNSIQIITGAGSPDTVVTAAAGSLFLRTDPAGATSRIYVNTDGITGWTNVTCAA